jgi:predicted ATPase/tRNA A-37 threonylcarbamoyl transferase component Bud32
MATPPPTIGSYEVLGELGRGGMGIVYRVRDTTNGRHAALKIVPPESLARPEAALRFKREFRAMQRVQHPNVIRVFEAGTHDGCPFFTMEVVDGQDIRCWLDGDEPIVHNGGRPPPAGLLAEEQRRRLNDSRRVRRLAEAIVQVGFALSSIHGHRIVHRDLKPDNILVSRAGVVKLMDFGIAKQLAAHSEQSSSGMVVGTFKYLSPEQALGADVDGRADLYCLGVILFELLAGRHPFYSENSVGYAYHHARKAPPPIDRFNPEVDPALKAICERLIEKDPNDRFATAEDLIAALRGAVDGLVDEHSQKGKRAPRAKAPPQKGDLFAPALVGREREMRTLLSLCEQAKKGRGAVAVVMGPKGIGKTRLLREVAAKARGLGVDVLIAQALKDSGLEYQPYIELLDRLMDESMRGRTKEELARLLGAEGAVLARYLGSFESLPPRARPKPAQALEPQGERARFLGAASAFLDRAAAAGPRVLVIDALHHADELSLDLTRHLAERIAAIGPGNESGAFRLSPLSLVLTVDPDDVRSDTAQRLIRDLLELQALLQLELKPLSAQGVGEMLQTMLGGSGAADVVGEVLYERTSGTPGLVEERIRAWAESGELSKQGREWVLVKRPHAAIDELDDDEVPTKSLPGRLVETFNELSIVVELRAATRADIPIPDFHDKPAERRVKRLGAPARDLAERAAVLGERFAGSVLARIALLPEDELLDGLDELLKSDVLLEEKTSGGYRFASVDNRQVLLDALSEEKRRHLHALVARTLEETAERSGRAPNSEALARHWLEAKASEKALEHLMRAARRALAASATQTAANLVREAQELFVHESARAPYDPLMARRDLDLVLLRLDVLSAVGEHKECVSLARRRVPRLRGAVDSRLVGEVVLRLAGSERVLGDVDEALGHVGEVLSITERGGAHSLRCRAKYLCGQVYEHKGDYDKSQRYFRDALELARTIGDELEEQNARSALAARHLEAGELVIAEAELKKLLSQARARGERLGISRYVNALGIAAHERGEFDEAEGAYREMIDLAKPAGDRRSVALGLVNIAVVRRDQSRTADALGLCQKAGRILLDIDDVELLSYVHIVEAQALLDKGDDGLALETAATALELAKRAGAAMREVEARFCLEHAKARLGDPEAASRLEKALESARAVNSNRLVLHGLHSLAEAELFHNRGSAAQRVLDEGLGRARRTGYARFVRRFETLAARIAAPA